MDGQPLARGVEPVAERTARRRQITQLLGRSFPSIDNPNDLQFFISLQNHYILLQTEQA